MGEVFRAWDYRLDRQVALKVPLEASQRSREVLDRFQIEVEAVERLNHENLCKLLDHDVGHLPPFLTMEYLEGGSLEERVGGLSRRRRPRTSLGLVRTLAMGLEHAHRHGVVHRDIKPTNVLFGADGRPRIADFGLAHPDRPAARCPDHRGAPGPRVAALHVARAGRRAREARSTGRPTSTRWAS